jgi:hypothetical protein
MGEYRLGAEFLEPINDEGHRGLPDTKSMLLVLYCDDERWPEAMAQCQWLIDFHTAEGNDAGRLLQQNNMAIFHRCLGHDGPREESAKAVEMMLSVHEELVVVGEAYILELRLSETELQSGPRSAETFVASVELGDRYFRHERAYAPADYHYRWAWDIADGAGITVRDRFSLEVKRAQLSYEMTRDIQANHEVEVALHTLRDAGVENLDRDSLEGLYTVSRQLGRDPGFAL